MSSSHQQIAKLASRNGFKGQILCQAATTKRLNLFGQIARHPESLEHKIIYRSCHSFRSRSSPYRVGRPRAHWAEVTSAQLIQRIAWLTQRPPTHDWDISHSLRKPVSQPEVWFIHGHSLHDFHKKTAHKSGEPRVRIAPTEIHGNTYTVSPFPNTKTSKRRDLRSP